MSDITVVSLTHELTLVVTERTGSKCWLRLTNHYFYATSNVFKNNIMLSILAHGSVIYVKPKKIKDVEGTKSSLISLSGRNSVRQFIAISKTCYLWEYSLYETIAVLNSVQAYLFLSLKLGKIH